MPLSEAVANAEVPAEGRFHFARVRRFEFGEGAKSIRHAKVGADAGFVPAAAEVAVKTVRFTVVSSIDYSDFYQKLKNEKGKEVFCKH